MTRRNPARSVVDLPPGWRVEIAQWDWGDAGENLRVSFEGDRAEGQIRSIRNDGTPALPPGVFMVAWASAPKGWGPLLYDVLLEAAGEAGVIPSRVSIKPAASAVWRYYAEKRPDVEKRALPRGCAPCWPDEPWLDAIYVKRALTVTRALDAAGLLVVKR